MKILIYARDQIRMKVRFILSRYGIETNDISTSADITVALGGCEKPDIVLIDREANNAASANAKIQKFWGVPTVLMIGKGKEKWQGLEEFAAAGYMENTLRNREFIACLAAIQRRVSVSHNEVSF